LLLVGCVPHSELADNAQYWLAESYYSKREFPMAITEFHKVIQLYPQSPKAPSSLLKIGYAYYEMGNMEQGKQELQRLIQQFPTSAEATLAEQMLKEGKKG
jgi:tol-pal system protein YbgF